MKTAVIFIFFGLFTFACTSVRNDISEPVIEEIEILSQGEISRDENYFGKLCGSFKLIEEQIKDYFKYSRLSSEHEINQSFEIFPCFSTGTMYIDGEKYKWKIRAGGVGEFYSNSKSIFRMCEKKCCKKVPGIC